MPGSKRPHELAAAVPPERLVAALVRNLAEAIGGRAAYCVPATTEPSSALTVVTEWPERSAKDWQALGEVAREPVAGGGVVLAAGPREWSDRDRGVIAETAGWLGVAAGLDRLNADHDRAETRAGSLRAEVTAARERFAQVRELERRRLVRAITTTTLRDLDDVRKRLRKLGEEQADQLAGGDADGPDHALAEVRGALDDLLDNFRTVVRGVYPAMLPEHGPRAALEELAATLPRRVRFSGDLGKRANWQIESVLYHAVAAVLNVLAGQDGELPITVEFGRDEALRVRVTASIGSMLESGLRTALGHDAERLAVLGGAMDCAVTDGAAVVTMRLAERIEPVAAEETVPPQFDQCALVERVRDLVRQGRQAAAGGPDRVRWDAVAERLAEPPRLAVVTDSFRDPTSWPDAARQSGLGVTVIVVDGPADGALGQEFLADDGPRGSVDAVLCLVPATTAFRDTLRSGRQRVVLNESASLPELARDLVSRGSVIAARRALVTMRELLPGLPSDHPLWWELDRVGAEAHEIAELELLDDLENADTHMLQGARTDATQLLGAHGTDPRIRLGLAKDADDGQVRAAADRAVHRWRAQAGHPSTGGRDRSACEVLVRTAEGLLIAARTQ